MNRDSKWVFIINPVAGNGFAATMDKEIRMMAERFSIGAEIVYTGRKGDAALLSKKYSEAGFTHIIAVGGDGTINEVASSIINNPDIVTGIIPAGTGNDFIQILGFPDRFDEKAWESFFSENIISMDAGSCNGMIFLNGMGLGFDAKVAAENFTEPGVVKKGGKNKYIWHILKTLLFYREQKMTVLTGGQSTETDCFINTVAIGRRFAGGFFLTPKAIADDGMLDICSIKKLSLLQRLRILTMVPKGTHITDKRVHYYKADRLTLAFNGAVPFHLDGELYFADNFDISVLPSALKIIYNPGGNHFFGPGALTEK